MVNQVQSHGANTRIDVNGEYMASEKIVAITGATSGIGEAVLKCFAMQRIPVFFSGRRAERVAELEREFNATEPAVHGYVGDVQNEGHVTDLFNIAKGKCDRIPNTFVLCAGHGLPGTLLGSDPAKWKALLEVNYLAVLYQLKECAAAFVLEADKDRCSTVRDIVIIGSTIGRTVSPFNPIYGSTKFALHSLAEGLRQEVCAKNIRVSLIEPGFVRTEFQATAGYDLEWFDSLEKDMGPFLAPMDIARSVDFIVHQPMHVHIDDIRIRPTRQKA